MKVHLPFPPPLHSLTTNAPGRGRVPTQRYQTWKVVASLDLKRQWPQGQGKIGGPVAVDILLERKDRRKRDLDNHAKALIDLLVSHDRIDDDRNVQDLRLRWGRDKGAVVEVTPA